MLQETSDLIEVTTRFVKKAMVEPLATVDLGLNSAVIHDVFYDSPFFASEFSAFEWWLVRSAKE